MIKLMNTNSPLSVSIVNQTIKSILENNFLIQDIWIEGELSNVKYYAKGNQFYFNLTDGKSVLNCVIYSQFLTLLTFQPQHGMKVYARGKIKVFQNKGQYIFQVVYLSVDGVGQQNLAFEELKKKLTSEGLFNTENKHPIPLYPKSIGVITSPDSAAMWDFIKTVRKEVGYVNISIIPAIMQGAQSALSVIDALNFSDTISVDLIVIIRGGGSKEDLACFNDELLVRRVYQHDVPILSGIGHETDFTLLDLVSDKSFATPTAVAKELIMPFITIKQSVANQLSRIENKLITKIKNTEMNLNYLLDTLQNNIQNKKDKLAIKIKSVSKQLAYANPLHQLQKGYSIVTKKESTTPIKSISDVDIDDSINIQVYDGIISSVIEGIHKNE